MYLIVIATNYQGTDFLEGCLASVMKYHPPDSEVLVIDTGSVEFLHFHKAEPRHKNVTFRLAPDTHRYETGALLYAYQSVSADRYLILQDSVTVKSAEFFEGFSRCSADVVVPLMTFPPRYDNDDHKKWVRDRLGSDEFSAGIFGSQFFATSRSLESVIRSIPLPQNKEESRAMERGWAVAFEQKGIRIESLEGEFDAIRVRDDDYRTFKKVLANRM